jgi:hypothetical protein
MKPTLLTLGLAFGLFSLGANAAQAQMASAPAPGDSKQKESADGSVKCPVTGDAVPKGKGVVVKVKGGSYRVKDTDCAKELAANPEKYLNEDGSPKNQ